ncbi:MAG: caspase family protein [Parvibaculaceae bacterium]
MPRLGHLTTVTSMAFSTDQKRIFTASGDGTVKIWDGGTAALIHSFKVDATWAYSIALSRDGRKLYTAGDSKAVQIIDIATGEVTHTLTGHTNSVISIALSADEKILASISSERGIKLWDSETGALIRDIDSGETPLTAMALAPDGRTLLTGDKSGMLKLWETATGNAILSFEVHAEGVNSIAFSPDGRSIVSSGADKTVKLWNAGTGKFIRQIDEDAEPVVAVAYSPDGKHMASTASNNTVKLWDAKTGKLKRRLSGHRNWMASLTFSPDGRRLLTGSADASAILWDIRTGESLLVLGSPTAGVTSIAYAPDGSRIAASRDNGTLDIRDARTGTLVRSFTAHADTINSVAFSSDSTRILSAGWDKTIKLWNAETGGIIHSFDGHTDVINAVAFSPDGRFALSGSRDKTMKLWDLETGTLVRDFVDPGQELVASVAFSPDGQRVASGGRDTKIRIWDVATGDLIRAFGLPAGSSFGDYITLTVFSPDGKSILSSDYSSNALQLWDAETGELIRSFDGHSVWILSAAFSPDGKRIVSCGGDDTVRLWDTESGALLHTLKGHTRFPYSVAFSPDGHRVLSGASDATIRLWDAETGAMLATLIGGGGTADSLALSPSGFFSVSGEGRKLVAVVQAGKAFSVEQFYQSLYRPDLVEEMFKGDPFGKHLNAGKKLNLGTVLDTGPPPLLVIEKAERTGSNARVTVRITNQGGGIGKIEWRIAGRTQAVEGERSAQMIEEDSDNVSTRSFPLQRGRNVISVTAYNARGLVASAPAEVVIDAAGISTDKRGKLYVLAVGVDKYAETSLTLRDAASDAQALARALAEVGRNVYDDVVTHPLLDADVTDRKLDGVFTELGKTIAPQDKFVFFLAGHGLTVDGKYYFLPQDFRPAAGDTYASKGIGQDRWQEWFARIKARSSVLLYDTCESGSVARSASTEKAAAMDRLTQAVGINVIAASDADQPAREGYRGHGLFTWALLDGLAKGDENKDTFIEIFELANHVGAVVPEVSKKEFGFEQRPRSRTLANFPLGLQVADVEPNGDVIPEQPNRITTREVTIELTKGTEADSDLKAFTLVRLIKLENGRALIARQGRELGFVPADALAELN